MRAATDDAEGGGGGPYLRLNVSVNNIVCVAIINRAQQLPEALLRLDRVHAVRVALQVLQDRPLDVLEDEMQLGLAAEDLDQIHDVVVLQLLEDAHLAQRGLAHLLVLVGLLELLDRDDLARLLVARLEDDAVRAERGERQQQQRERNGRRQKKVAGRSSEKRESSVACSRINAARGAACAQAARPWGQAANRRRRRDQFQNAVGVFAHPSPIVPSVS